MPNEWDGKKASFLNGGTVCWALVCWGVLESAGLYKPCLCGIGPSLGPWVSRWTANPWDEAGTNPREVGWRDLEERERRDLRAGTWRDGVAQGEKFLKRQEGTWGQAKRESNVSGISIFLFFLKVCIDFLDHSDICSDCLPTFWVYLGLRAGLYWLMVWISNPKVSIDSQR